MCVYPEDITVVKSRTVPVSVPVSVPVIMSVPSSQCVPQINGDIIPDTGWQKQWHGRFDYPRFTHCCGLCGVCSFCTKECQNTNRVYYLIQNYTKKHSTGKPNVEQIYWGLNTNEGTLVCCPSTLCTYAVAVCECSIVENDCCCFSMFSSLIIGTLSIPFCLPCVLGNTCMNTLLYCITCDSRNFDLSWFC